MPPEPESGRPRGRNPSIDARRLRRAVRHSGGPGGVREAGPGATLGSMDAFASIAEARLREAVARGELDNPLAGRPLPPDVAAGVPRELQAGYRMLKNAGVLPEEMELRKSIVSLGDLLAACGDEAERRRLTDRLRDLRLVHAIRMERRRVERSRRCGPRLLGG